MPRFTNNPQMQGADGNNLIRRFEHQPMTVDHGDIRFTINANGKVDIIVPDKSASSKDESVYDQVQVPASLIFKIAQLLKATRKVKYVPVGDGNHEAPAEDTEM